MSENKSMGDLIKEYQEQIAVLERELIVVEKQIRAIPVNNHELLRKKVIFEDMILDLKYGIACMTEYLN